jgi:hypothetical protein
MAAIRKGAAGDGKKPLALRTSAAGNSHPLEPGGWHLTYAAFSPALYLKLMGIAEAGPARVARLPHINNVHAYLAALRNISVPVEVCRVHNELCMYVDNSCRQTGL